MEVRKVDWDSAYNDRKNVDRERCLARLKRQKAKTDYKVVAGKASCAFSQPDNERLCKAVKKENDTMRSDLIFGALAHVENRYQLCQLASKATRKLHKPNTRLQDTTNDVLVRFHDSSPVAPNPVPVKETPVQQRRAA